MDICVWHLCRTQETIPDLGHDIKERGLLVLGYLPSLGGGGFFSPPSSFNWLLACPTFVPLFVLFMFFHFVLLFLISWRPSGIIG